jgi:hypothetical protein
MMEKKSSSGFAPGVKYGEVLLVDAFPKDRIGSANRRVTEILGIDSMETPIRRAESHNPDITYNWSPTDLNQLLNTAHRALEMLGTGIAGDIDHLRRFISSISAEGLDSEDLPFYILTIRIGLNSTALAESTNLEGDIRGVRTPFGFLLQSLGGHSSRGVSWGPSAPIFVILGVKTNQKLLSLLQQEARDSTLHRAASTASPNDVVEHRRLIPVGLSWDKEPDIWSHFILASNASAILGHMDQFGLLGIRTPYMIWLSPDDSLLEFDRVKIPIALSLRVTSFLSLWSISNNFVLPLAVHAWTGALFLEVQDLERAMASVSTDLLSISDGLVNKSSLDELTRLGLRSSTLDVQIGLIESELGDTVEKWRCNSIADQVERRLPSLSRWPSPHIGEDFEGGFLSFFAEDLRRRLDRIEEGLQDLERRIELLSRQANDAVLRDSGKKMEMATNAALQAQRAVVNMTYVLVMLTFLLVALALWQNGAYSYAVIVAAMTLVVVARFLAIDNRRLYWLIGVALVDFFVLKCWPSDISWLIPLVPIVAIVIPVTWWALAPYAHPAELHRE